MPELAASMADCCRKTTPATDSNRSDAEVSVLRASLTWSTAGSTRLLRRRERSQAFVSITQPGTRVSHWRFSSMMLNADWKREMQQKAVLMKAKISIQITSPQTGSIPISTTVDSRLTTITPIPYPRASAEPVSVQKTANESNVVRMPGMSTCAQRTSTAGEDANGFHLH